jgi:hypothetical protein
MSGLKPGPTPDLPNWEFFRSLFSLGGGFRTRENGGASNVPEMLIARVAQRNLFRGITEGSLGKCGPEATFPQRGRLKGENSL